MQKSYNVWSAADGKCFDTTELNLYSTDQVSYRSVVHLAKVEIEQHVYKWYLPNKKCSLKMGASLFFDIMW